MRNKQVIAHRGASGYLPEHSMESKAMAHAMNVDFIEQDVVMSKDNHLLVLHDLFLDITTNVRSVFPQRARADGRFYVIDFTLEEILSLQMTEAFGKDEKALYPTRFPLWKSHFQVHTLAQEIELIQGLNKSRNKQVGIYPEIKAPAFHQREGKDISLALLTLLKEYGYQRKSDNIFVQCFDPIELQRIQYALFPQLAIQLPIVQLMALTCWQESVHELDGQLVNYDYDWMYEVGAMQKIARYADAIGPWYAMLVDNSSSKESLIINDLTQQAHQANLKVHPYTLRSDSHSLPSYVDDFDALLDIFYYQLDVDALFTDFPDVAVNFLQRHR